MPALGPGQMKLNPNRVRRLPRIFSHFAGLDLFPHNRLFSTKVCLFCISSLSRYVN